MNKYREDKIKRLKKSSTVPERYKEKYIEKSDRLARKLVVKNYEIVKANKEDLKDGLCDDGLCVC